MYYYPREHVDNKRHVAFTPRALGDNILHISFDSGIVSLTKISVTSAPQLSLALLATDAARQLNVLRHDRHALGVDGAQVGILEVAV